MKTSSPYCRSEMRPEYLAEFEAAGVPPYSQVAFPAPMPPIQPERRTTRKVILETSTSAPTADPVGQNLAAIVVGASLVFIIGLFLPIMVLAFMGGIMKASRRGRRRSW